MQVNALVITGYGINCEREMSAACRLAGATPKIAHAHSLLNKEIRLSDFHMLLLPGGFSFGDELGAAKAFANRISYTAEIKGRLKDFVKEGGCILGVCNGFQLLVKLGLLPGFQFQGASLACNDSGRFENRWTHHKVFRSPCIFTHGIEHLYLPIRHGEGKLVFKDNAVYEKIVEDHQVVFRYATPEGTPTEEYPENPNGSFDSIAGICDPTGRILGMMAHPEAAMRMINHPRWTRLREEAKRHGSTLPFEGDGLKLFKNAVNYIKENL